MRDVKVEQQQLTSITAACYQLTHQLEELDASIMSKAISDSARVKTAQRRVDALRRLIQRRLDTLSKEASR
jgi:Tfp pilus assembly PilM family ATPase